MVGFILSCATGHNTYSQWAHQISMLSGCDVSRQGIFSRIGKGAAGFARQLLQYFLLQQTCYPTTGSLFSSFGRVLLQDSTTLSLPQSLNKVFKGSRSRGKQTAIARIQTIIDITRMRFLHFSLSSFTDNDQSASNTIMDWVKRTDLVIRDMGYFTFDSFKQLIDKKAFFLSRLKFGVHIYDEQGRRLTVKKLTRRKAVTDQWVYLGMNKEIKVRLVMIPLPADQTAERIRRAKQNRDKRLRNSPEYFQWLGYTVLITNVEQQVWLPQQAAQAYRVRWQIEIIFKSWKSGLRMQQILHQGCTNEHRVKVNIYLLLLFTCLLMMKLYTAYRHKVSLLRLSIYVMTNLKDLFALEPQQMNLLIIRHCCYDKRKDRTILTHLYQT